MKLQGFEFAVIDWSRVEREEKPADAAQGGSGTAVWRTVRLGGEGGPRVRIVEYPAGYRSDHWCVKGHVVHVLEGAMRTELQDGRVFELGAGQTYCVADGAEAHRSSTEVGVRLLIVD